MKYTNFKKILFYLFLFISPVLLFSVLLFAKNIYPFGENSIYIHDMEYQYHDFYCYLKDVLSGNASAEYSFSKSLGGSTVPLVGYYLLSPVNLLTVFFKKGQMQLFVYLATSIKIGLCGLFAGIFVKKRFELEEKLCIAVAVAYALSQYSIAQASNLMWLDGVYMLPLVMLGIYRYVNEGKALMFYVANACSILFCWYTGYMNCIFAFIYYLAELALKENEFKPLRQLKKTLRFALLEVLSVLLSCFVFLPVLLGQSSGRGFGENVLEYDTNGTAPEILRGFILGTKSYPGAQIVLFVSVFALLFFFAFWFLPKGNRKEKLVGGVLVGIMVASTFFVPIENIWCGFRFEYSYYYRFAYITLMSLLFVSAMSMKKLSDAEACVKKKTVLKGGVTFLAVSALAYFISDFDVLLLWGQLGIIVFYMILILLARGAKGGVKYACTALIAIMFSVEVVLNAVFIVEETYYFDAERNRVYAEKQQALIDSIRPEENEFYRIEQTTTRGGEGYYAYTNESMAYDFYGLQTYTSCYDQKASEILIAGGYTIVDFPSFYNNPILPMDSFLGVKYILSGNEYAGYKKTGISNEYKSVYLNEYALPFAFSANEKVLAELEYTNSFEYINGLYSAVLGNEVRIMKKAEGITSVQDGKAVEYTLEGIPQDALLYVSFENEYFETDGLYVNGQYFSEYNKMDWGTWQNVVFLGEAQDVKNIRLENANLWMNDIQADFYYVDMDAFEGAVNEIQSNAAVLKKIRDGKVLLECDSKEAGAVLLTVPYEEGWSLKVNGKKAEVCQGMGQFIAICVEEGINEIELTYSAKGKLAGCTLTVVSVAVYFAVFRKRKAKGEKI